ncbi:MAG: methyltransferase [Pseudomonadota bacterium]
MSHNFTQDSIFRGAIKVFQPRRGEGYRYTVDSVLLGYFASGRKVKAAVDIGAGCGIVGFILLHSGAARSAVFVERDRSLAAACRLGIEANGLGGRAEVVRADVNQGGWLKGLKNAGLIVSNPPYRTRGSGIVPSSESVAAAKHEIAMTLDDVVKCSARALGSRGRLCMIAAPERLDDVFRSAGSRRMSVLRMRFVHAKPGREAGSVLLELKPVSGKATKMRVLEPLIINHEDGSYTREMADLLDGKIDRGLQQHQSLD